MVAASAPGEQPMAEFESGGPVPFRKDPKTRETYARRFLAKKREDAMSLAMKFQDAEHQFRKRAELVERFQREAKSIEHYQEAGFSLIADEDMPKQPTYRQIDVNYRPAFGQVRCSTCKFQRGATGCSIVAGEIRGGDVCDLFAADSEQGLPWRVGVIPAPRHKVQADRDVQTVTAELARTSNVLG
jgi:hypothetical protein